jgi:hypothetical protein
VSDPRSEYTRRRDRWHHALVHGERVHLLVSNARLAVAALAALTVWLVIGRYAMPPSLLAVPAIVFLALVVVHARVLQRNERAARARRLYHRGLERLDGRWAGDGPDGARFTGEHPYARDLDIFGVGSLFQLISIARTEAGEDALADWLRAPAAIDEIRARQQAVRELAPRVDFREDLAVLAAEAQVGRTTALTAWAGAAAVGLSASVAIWLGAAVAVTVSLLAAGFAGLVSGVTVLLWLGVHFGLAAVWRRQVHEVLGRIDLPAYELNLLAALLARLEREPFDSPRLRALHGVLVTGDVPPSRRIAPLQLFVSAVDSMHNMLFAPIGHLLLVPSLAAIAIDRWHAAHGRALGAWLTAIGQFEALSSFAAQAYERPAYPFPELVSGEPVVDAAGLAHPLLDDEAIPNDVRLGGDAARVLVVSGSNMSGKSTLLRAVGVNVVLALAGAPVRASRMTLSPLAIGATLRVEDSLQAGHSRFYTEILRIREIVETTRGPLPVLFLLDEILHGTNSHDRRIGAEAIVRSLVDGGAIGLVTTHDLALTQFVSEMDGRARNVHFEDRLEHGRMLFDYRMRDGVVERSNALALMRAIGLDV